MLRVEHLMETPEEQAEREFAEATAADTKAVQDFNVMMGILVDPGADEEVE